MDVVGTTECAGWCVRGVGVRWGVRVPSGWGPGVGQLDLMGGCDCVPTHTGSISMGCVRWIRAGTTEALLRIVALN